MSEKEDARAFLDDLQQRLAKQPDLASPRELDRHIRETNADAKTVHARRHLRLPESAFLNQYVLPELFAAVTEYAGLEDDDARCALLNEYYPSMPGLSVTTPARTAKHPFTKVLGARPSDVYEDWSKGKRVQSCPDFALRAPFPHKIVFEGKYFAAKGTQARAEREIATDIYQAFFYRGLSSLPAKKKRAAWDYDYACLVAYDASRDGTLREAWRALPHKVRKSFWDDANLYVMILRGDE